MSEQLNRKRPRDKDKNEARDLESGPTPAKSMRRSTAAAGSCSDVMKTPPGLPQDHTCLVYIVEKKVSSGHLSHLRAVARKKGFPLATTVRLMSTPYVYMHPQYMHIHACAVYTVLASYQVRMIFGARFHGPGPISLLWLLASSLAVDKM